MFATWRPQFWYDNDGYILDCFGISIHLYPILPMLFWRYPNFPQTSAFLGDSWGLISWTRCLVAKKRRQVGHRKIWLRFSWSNVSNHDIANSVGWCWIVKLIILHLYTSLRINRGWCWMMLDGHVIKNQLLYLADDRDRSARNRDGVLSREEYAKRMELPNGKTKAAGTWSGANSLGFLRVSLFCNCFDVCFVYHL